MKIEEYPKITAILRGYSYEQAMTVIELLSQFHKQVGVEVTTNNSDYLKIIEDGSQQFGDSVFVGVGTVLNYEQAYQSIKAGAKFMLAPQGFSKEIFALAKTSETITVPAAMTPSEISQMFQEGADIVKVFPAITLGPDYFKQLKGPFGAQALMAVGGVSLKNIQAFREAGVQYFGIGSSMFSKADVEAGDVAALKRSVEEYLQ